MACGIEARPLREFPDVTLVLLKRRYAFQNNISKLVLRRCCARTERFLAALGMTAVGATG